MRAINTFLVYLPIHQCWHQFKINLKAWDNISFSRTKYWCPTEVDPVNRTQAGNVKFNYKSINIVDTGNNKTETLIRTHINYFLVVLISSFVLECFHRWELLGLLSRSPHSRTWWMSGELWLNARNVCQVGEAAKKKVPP